MASPELEKAEPCYEQAVCDLAKATEEQRGEITRLSSELAASRERERALERAFRLTDAIACDAIRWGYFVSDGALQQLADARALADANTQGGDNG